MIAFGPFNREKLEALLKQACLLTQASWAVWADRTDGIWQVIAAYGIRGPLLTRLTEHLQQSVVDSWMCGAFSSHALRSRTFPIEGLTPARAVLLPVPGTFSAMLVAGELGKEGRQLWRSLAEILSMLCSEVQETNVSQLQEKLLSDLPHALETVLAALLKMVWADGGWLAVHRAQRLEIRCQINCPNSQGKVFSAEGEPLVYRLLRTREAIVLDPKRPEWKYLPFFSKEEIQAQGWLGIPFYAGNRLIAVLALWRKTPFRLSEKKEVESQARIAGPILEASLLFEEMAGYLHRLALLNDFVLTISAAQSVEQIVRRTFAFLARSFSPDATFLLLLDGERVREYRPQDSRLETRVVPMAMHPFGEYLAARRRSNILEGEEKDEMRSTLYAHLRHRGQTIGLLVLQRRTPKAFKSHDEQLLGVLSSHLASLIEYSRLREEAEARARRLGLIHEVVEQIIVSSDLKEIVQIVADLLVEYFRYEFVQVQLFDPPLCGVAGKHPEVLSTVCGEKFAKFLTEQALQDGHSLLINNLPAEWIDESFPWKPGSAVVVLLREGAEVLGTLQVGSSQPDAFGEIDLLALESLAGVLSAVTRNVKQYVSLQNTVQELRITQAQLKQQIEIQRLTERRLLQAAKLAAVGEMAASVAHELNNPLTSVVGFSELILENLPEGSTAHADMQIVLREARRAREVVRRLLDFARQGEITRTRYDLNRIVNEVFALVRHLLHINGIQAQLELREGLPWVYVSVNQIKQVLLNLIHNAIQAMPTGGQLTIVTRQSEREDRPWVVCDVKDTGIGILPEHRERIFEPFFTTKAQQGGTGLGLSISYDIITDHGGMIEVQSEPEKGSCFSIWLPV